MTNPVIKDVKVGCDAQTAFDVFVNKTTTWWPLAAHSVSAGAGKAARAVIIEPNLGGAVYEIKFDGSRAEWGEVTAFEPGVYLALTWHPGTNTDSPTKVEVRFEDVADGARVTLTHSGWEVWAEKADDMRNGYNSGWVRVFEELFAGACA